MRNKTIFFFIICIVIDLLSASSASGAILLIPTATPITLTPTVNPISAETYDGSLQLIYNGFITATATGGTAPYTYTLIGPSSPTPSVSNPYFPGLLPGSYTLTVTDAAGQTASATATMGFQFPQPSLSVSSIVQPSLCRTTDGGFTLNASGGTAPYTNSIDGGNNYTATSTYSNLSGGMYYVSAKDVNGQICIIGSNPTSATGGVIALSAPFCMINPGISASLSACGNDGNMQITVYSNSPLIDFSLDGTNSWSLPLNPAFPNTYQYDTTGLAPGLYNTVTTDITGNTTRFSISIAKFCIPPIVVSTSPASCNLSDGAVRVNAGNPNPNYSYSMDGVHYQLSPIFPGLAAGIYNLSVRDNATGATNNTTFLIDQICPTVTATATPETCAGNDGTITASGHGGLIPVYQYSIDGGMTYQSAFIFYGLKAGTYKVWVKDFTGGTGTTAVTVPKACLRVSAAIVNSSCDNSSGSITATSNGGGTAPYTYSIDGLNFQLSNLFSGLAPGNYTLTIRDNATPALTADTIIALGIDTNLTVYAGTDLRFCRGGSVTLSATSNGSSFSWSPAIGLDNPAALDPKASPTDSTKYYLTATLGVCSLTDSMMVDVKPVPVADAGRDTSICTGQSVQLNGGGSSSGIGGSSSGGSGGTGSGPGNGGTSSLSYQWTPSTDLDQFASADPNVNRPPATITYRLVVTDANGCSSVNDAQVTVTVTTPPKVFAGDDTAILTGQPIRLQAIDVNNSGFDSYSWSPADGLSDPSIANPIADPLQATTYTVLASTPDGCQGSGSVTIKIYSSIGIFVPNAFTPNGDGHNDILRAIPLGIKTFHYFSVFNRAGQRIFFTANPSEGWDGTFNGRPQASGVYVWIASGIDLNGQPVASNGTVTLIR